MNNLAALRVPLNPQRILRRLREILGGAAISPHEKLNAISKIIASEMGADACSIYILRAGVILELFSNYGLNPQAIHKTKLKLNQGVIGNVATNGRPLILSDVKSHSNYVLVEGLGEEDLNAFAGVPINRGGMVLGVLSIQNFHKRLYLNEEVELLQTISMVLAELIASGDIISKNELISFENFEALSTTLKGVALNHGLAKGFAVLHHPDVPIKRMISDDSVVELKNFDSALWEMQKNLKVLFSQSGVPQEGEQKSVLEAYQMYANDYGWIKGIRKLIESGLSAEASVQKYQMQIRQEIKKSNDQYLKERLWDFEDVTNRLLHYIVGDNDSLALESKSGIIIVARSMGPAELLDYEKYNIQGLLLEEGLDTAHVSIVARALNIPVISRISQISLKIEQGDLLLMNGDLGKVVVNPNDEEIEEFEKAKIGKEKRHSHAITKLNLPSISKDGVRVSLKLNAGLKADLKYIHYECVGGVGLFRTEIPFMLTESLPDLNKQIQIYGDVFTQAQGKPVYFRTLDIGGDKVLPYLRELQDENPALGWRAIRIGLDRPILLRQQLRALIKAAEGRELNIIFPMVAKIEEVVEVKAILEIEKQHCQKLNIKMPAKISLGVMLEVPSLLWQLEQLMPMVDFVSVGSNDLFQFFFAADRSNNHMVHRFDPLTPTFVGLLKYILRCAKKHKIPVTICGEMASNPIDTIALLGMGFRELSIASAAIPSILGVIQSINIREVTNYINYLLGEKVSNCREHLVSYAKDHNIEW